MALLAACAGEPQARGTLPPLPSGSPSPSGTPTPLPSGEPSATASASPTTGSSGSPGATPTATPTAPVPEGLTAEQLEAAATAEAYFSSFSEAVRRGDIAPVADLQTSDCTCGGVEDFLQGVIDAGAEQRGGENRVLSVDAAVGGKSDPGVILSLTTLQEEGVYVTPDGREGAIPAESGPTDLRLRWMEGRWLVAGTESPEGAA